MHDIVTEEMRRNAAKRMCEIAGDDWTREGPKGLMTAYGPMLDAAILAILPDIGEAFARIAAIHSQYPIDCDYDQGYADARKEVSRLIRAAAKGE